VSLACRETVLRFACEGADLVGILSQPPDRPGDVALLIVVGGPQYRAGSHRQVVRLARHAAAQGIAALRFDYRGMGDSDGEARDFQQVTPDIGAAIDALHGALPGLRGVVIYGLCDAASAALLYLDARPDPRVRGLVLQNPWARSAQAQAATLVQHYYGRRLRSPEFWKKLLGGGIGPRAVLEWWRHRRQAAAGAATAPASFQARMARAWDAAPCPILLQLSGEDLTAREFLLDWAQRRPDWARRPRLSRRDHPTADHTFSRSADEAGMLEELLTWWKQEINA
jgi:exosortase A-associated hydrolase 1